jgi:outer membrane biosynthesis protein TonB
MPSLASILSPEEPRSASTIANTEDWDASLLELRTEAGPVYVCPSKWERIRLKWTFRHFHVLPPQVLSRSDQRLIEKLSHSAVVTPSLPVPSSCVFGVVEKVRLKPPANRVVPLRTEPSTQPFLVKSEFAKSLGSVKQTGNLEALGGSFPQWGAVGALAAVGFTVIAVVYGIPMLSGKHVANNGEPPRLHPAAIRPPLVAPKIAALPTVEKPRHALAAPRPKPPQVLPELAITGEPVRPGPVLATVPATIVEPRPVISSTTAQPLFVSELPQGHFAYPIVSEPDLVGELHLKALIGADGSVKEVSLLSGNPKLAEVAMRAVRQWHYHPYQVLGSPVEVETQIKMNFFGEDAVSIASVANAPGALRESPTLDPGAPAKLRP